MLEHYDPDLDDDDPYLDDDVFEFPARHTPLERCTRKQK